MRDRTEIYTIMVCEKLEEDIYPSGKHSGFPIYGSSRVVGYYRDYADAQKALTTNALDLHETCYDYGCIEKVSEGIYQCGMLMGWYKYDKESDSYKPIETPDFDKHTCGRTIG